MHYFTFQCFAPLPNPCPTPTHILCLLLSRALPSWEPNTHTSLASQHTHPLPFSHTLPFSTFSSHALFLPWCSSSLGVPTHTSLASQHTHPLPFCLLPHTSLAYILLSRALPPFAFEHTHSFPSTPCSALSRLPHTFLAFSSHALFPRPPHLSAGPCTRPRGRVQMCRWYATAPA